MIGNLALQHLPRERVEGRSGLTSSVDWGKDARHDHRAWKRWGEGPRSLRRRRDELTELYVRIRRTEMKAAPVRRTSKRAPAWFPTPQDSGRTRASRRPGSPVAPTLHAAQYPKASRRLCKRPYVKTSRRRSQDAEFGESFY